MANYPQSPIIRHFFMRGQSLAFAKGQILIGNDPSPDAVYFISTGYVKIYSVSSDGDEFLHIIYGDGEVFPIIWAYTGVEPDSLFYETISSVSLWRISRYWFNVYIRRDQELATAMSNQMARQFQMSADRLDNLEYKKADERVAYRLLFLASRFGHRDGDHIIIEAPVTHELFANSINLARESVSRETEKLEKENIIKKYDGHIRIIDIKALAGKLSQPGSLNNWHLF